MGLKNFVGAGAHDAMHRLPGMPPHARAAELNSHQHRPLRNRPLRNRPLPNRPLRNPDSRNERPPRLLAGWQAWLGRRFGRGQR
jgi:hypothetical protein